jgi:hypothetical protein
MSESKDSLEEGDEGLEMTPEENTYRYTLLCCALLNLSEFRRAIEQEKAVYRESFERLRVLKPEIEHIRKILEKSRATLQTQFDSWYNSLHARDGAVLQQSTQSRSNYQANGGNETDSKRQYSERNMKLAGEEIESEQPLSARRKEVEERNKKLSSQSNSVNDSDGEDEVNEDIMAFYKAKEELLKRRG